jgi:hypothetical protein
MGFVLIPASPPRPLHWRTKLTDEQVEQMRVLHEEHGWGYRRLAKHFKVHRSTSRDICIYRRR